MRMVADCRFYDGDELVGQTLLDSSTGPLLALVGTLGPIELDLLNTFVQAIRSHRNRFPMAKEAKTAHAGPRQLG